MFKMPLLAPMLATALAFIATALVPPDALAQAKPVKAQPKTAKLDTGAALNLSLRLPMLAERMTKAYAARGQKVLETRTRRQLDDAAREFVAAKSTLQTNAPTPEIKDNYELLEQLFDEFNTLTKEPVSQAVTAKLAEQNEELVWIATKGAQLMQAHLKSARGDLIATAGDVRVLTQRIAKLYLFRSWGIKNDVVAKDLAKAEADYLEDMKKLTTAPQNTDAIKSDLALAQTQYVFLGQAIARLNANQTSVVELEHVVKTCDNILEVMERVTRLYEGVK